MGLTQADELRVWFVTIRWHDGTITERAFADKTAAAAWLHLIPQAQAAGDADYLGIARASLRPSGLGHN